MRYFFSFPGPEAALASRIVAPALGGAAVADTGPAQALAAGVFSAFTRAVEVTPVAMAADNDLASAAGTAVEAGTGQHRHKKADEGWIYTCLGATFQAGCAQARFGAWRRF